MILYYLHHILIFKIHCSTRFSFLQFFFITQLKQIELMTREAASCEKVFN